MPRMLRPAIVTDPLFKDHVFPGHPEAPARLDAALEGLRLAGVLDDARRIAVREARMEELCRIHAPDYVDRVLSILEGSAGHLDADTFFSQGSRKAALCAAGSGIDLAMAVHDRVADWGFALVRPPGHHAVSNRPMGFCIFNNIAVAAAALLERADVDRIAIIDWDVHHGNGTQESFYARPDLLFASMHQWPHYPGSGSVQDIGDSEGTGYTLNFPFPAGTGESAYLCAIDEVIAPVLEEFRPDHILVSAGFDAHRDDYLSSMALDAESFGAMAARIKSLADDLCRSRLTLFLEGGYHLDALRDSICATAKALNGVSAAPRDPDAGRNAALRVVRQVRDRLKPYWKALA